MTERADVRLRRLLLALPQLADGQEHEIAEIAAAVGCDSATVVSDLSTLLTRDYEPAGFVEGVQLYLTSQRVALISKTFLRPMRLTATELAALDLGLAMLLAERPPDERPMIEAARRKLAALRAVLPQDLLHTDFRHASLETPSNAATLATVRRALHERRPVQIEYQGGDDDESTSRTVRPYALLHAQAMWYLAAYCLSSDDVRTFRADRISSAALLDETFEIPTTWSPADVLHGERVLSADSPRELRIRYGPRVARWVAEREGMALERDGSVTITHPMVDAAWAVRHVMQYGAEAEVLAPDDVRQEVARRLRRLVDNPAFSNGTTTRS